MSTEIVPPTEKQMQFRASLLKQLKLTNMPVPTTKTGASAQIADLKYQLTTEQLTALVTKTSVDPAVFDAQAIKPAIDRKILAHGSMTQAGVTKIHEQTTPGYDPAIAAAQEELRQSLAAPFEEQSAIDGMPFEIERHREQLDAQILAHPSMKMQGITVIHREAAPDFDQKVFDLQERLRTRFELPYRQKHVDFELARLNLLQQQRLTGHQAALESSEAPYEDRYRTMLSELKRLKQLPTRKQLSRIKSYHERNETTFTLPTTRAEASAMVKDIVDELESAARAAESGNAPSDEALLPGAIDDHSPTNINELGGADGTAYHENEYDRVSPAPWQNDYEEGQTANMTPEEAAPIREAQRDIDMNNSQDHSDSPTAQRGDWGDEEYELRPPTEKQYEFFETLMTETGVRVQGPEDEASPVDGFRIWEGTIRSPQSSSEMAQAIDALVTCRDEQKTVIAARSTISRMGATQREELSSALHPEEQEVFAARFVPPIASRTETAAQIGVSEKTIERQEQGIANKIKRLTDGQNISGAQGRSNYRRLGDDPSAGASGLLPT